MYFDTHAHLDDEQFDAVRDDVVQRAREAGVSRIIAVGTTLDTSRICIDLAHRYDLVEAAVGIQPNYCSDVTDELWDQVAQLTTGNHVVAVGETGLDRYWDYTPFDVQQDFFARHLRLAQQTELPVIIHMRDCGHDIIEMLQEAAREGVVRGVMHSFTGDADLAAECVKLGLHISFAGMVTYRKSDELRQVAAAVPDDRLLIETDCPYLSPHPCRGQRPNEPALIVHTAECLAQVRGVEASQLAQLTHNNARALFGV